jgi:hypothetical protein
MGPSPTNDAATKAGIGQDAGQGDGQAERQDQPKECYEWNALFPASRPFLISP